MAAAQIYAICSQPGVTDQNLTVCQAEARRVAHAADVSITDRDHRVIYNRSFSLRTRRWLMPIFRLATVTSHASTSMLNPRILSPDTIAWLARKALSELNAYLCEVDCYKENGNESPEIARVTAARCRAVASAVDDEVEKKTWLDLANKYEGTISEEDRRDKDIEISLRACRKETSQHSQRCLDYTYPRLVHADTVQGRSSEPYDLIDHSRSFVAFDSNGTPCYAPTITARIARPGEDMCGHCGCIQDGHENGICPGCGNNQPTIICKKEQEGTLKAIFESAGVAPAATVAVPSGEGAAPDVQEPSKADASEFQRIIVDALAQAFSTTPEAVRRQILTAQADEVLDTFETLMSAVGPKAWIDDQKVRSTTTDDISKKLIHCGACAQMVHTEPACGWPNQQLRCCDNCHAHIMYWPPNDGTSADNSEGTKPSTDSGTDVS